MLRPMVLVYEALPKLGRALLAKWPWDFLYHNRHHTLLELFVLVSSLRGWDHFRCVASTFPGT